MRALVVVEADKDLQVLIETVFSLDSRFTVAGVSTTAEDALQMARTTKPAMIVLDPHLAGKMTGLEVAPRLKEVAPTAKIILFTYEHELGEEAANEPAIDALVLRADSTHLLRVAQQLLGMPGSTT